jgi:hypothetical protein
MALLHCCHRGSRLTKMQHEGHMQSTETKGVEEKLDDETSGSAGFSGIKKKELLLLKDKPVFLDPQLLDFPVQRGAGNSEFRCRTFWARNFPVTFRKSPFKTFSLLILESVWQFLRAGSGLTGQAFSIQKVSPLDRITDLSNVLQLTDISRPCIRSAVPR